jgi:predicted DNA binding CopG/RHH family protein
MMNMSQDIISEGEDESENGSDKEELLMQKLEEIGNSGRTKHKTFEGVPKQWHQTIRVRNPETQRVKLYFKCKYPDCGSVFKKSCNLRDHFRKHTGLRPFQCPFC